MVPVLAATLVAAQQLALTAAPAARTAPAREAAALATRISGAAPRLDGRLDDAAWTLATPLGGFEQYEPSWGAAASESTAVRVLYSDDALYVGIRAFDSRADQIVGQLTRRDMMVSSDVLGVSIDAWNDKRTAYHFAVNAAGVQRDFFQYDDTSWDVTWDGVWESAVARDSQGWSAEFRIPFSQLRFAAADSVRFGFNIYRWIPRKTEGQRWRVPPPGSHGEVSTYGTLEGISGISAPLPVEVAPYVLGSGRLAAAAPGDPFGGNRTGTSLGADFRAGITRSLTFTGAINPDFGQVEADPAALNLSASELFLPERRPFFSEGMDLFRFTITAFPGGPDALFYSRRIGRAPQLNADPRGGWVDAPGGTTIIGAGKVTGRTPSGWVVGALAALTNREDASVLDSANAHHSQAVEPRTLYTVARLGRELRGGRTTAGLFGTLTARDLGPGEQSLRQRATVGGISLDHRFGPAAGWQFAGQVTASRVSGSTAAITATQRSSVRYYQRPDNAAADLDTTRTTLAGHAGTMELGKRSGAWTGGMRYTWRSPGFEANDLGFHVWSGQRHMRANGGWRSLTPGRWFQQFRVDGLLAGNFLWEGPRVQALWEIIASATTRGNWWGESQILWRAGGLDPFLLRGGPAMRLPGNWFVRQTIETDGRRPIWFGATLSTWGYPGENYRGTWGTFRAVWRPTPAVEIQLAPRFDTWDDSRAWVTAATLNGTPAWVVGQRRITVTAMGLRANATFSPSLSLQAFAEPFVSRGRFASFSRVLDPHARSAAERQAALTDAQLSRSGESIAADLDGDGAFETPLGRPDFTTVSLRSNVVLRWEYRQASTLFIVWQHGREGSSGRDAGLASGIDDLLRTGAQNTLLVKLSYWLRVR